MGLKQVVSRRAIHCFIRIRPKGFYSSGVFVPTTPEESFCRGNIQPASQEDIERLPEGARSDGAVTVFTLADLKTAEVSPTKVADRIRHDDTLYEVSSVSHWPSNNRVVCTKVGQ